MDELKKKIREEEAEKRRLEAELYKQQQELNEKVSSLIPITKALQEGELTKYNNINQSLISVVH